MIRLLLFLLLIITPLISRPEITIGLVIDGKWMGNSEIIKLFQQEVEDLLSQDFKVTIPADKTLYADWSLEGVKTRLDQHFADNSVDVVIALGVIGSSAVIQRGPLPKPTLAPFVLDIALLKAPEKNGRSGVKNLSYLSIPSTINRDISGFQEIVPFKKLTILLNKGVSDAIPNLEKGMVRAIDMPDLEVEVFEIQTLEDATSAINENTEAIYMAPLLNFTDREFNQLVQEMIRLKIPTFSLFGITEVERGILASLSPDYIPRLMRRLALNIQRILLGTKPEEIPFAFAPGEELSLNMNTAKAIDVFPSWGLINEALIIENDTKEIARQLTLKGVIQEGVKTNYSLLSKEREVKVGQQDVRVAMANLLPQLEASATGIQIDDDRAGIFQVEKSAQVGATVSQVLFSDGAWAGYTAQQEQQRALEAEYHEQKMDLIESIAQSYLQVLSAKTAERIQKENLKLTRSNLELARVREAVGYSGSADVYRWESQIASNRRDVITANADRNISEIALNTLLARPMEEDFETLEFGMNANSLLEETNAFSKFINNPFSFKVFRKFAEQKAIVMSPEVQQIDAAIAAQERLLKNATRRFFLPDLVAQFEWSNRFWEDGVGTPVDPSFGDETNWTATLNASLSLFAGGEKFATRAAAVETLKSLKSQKDAVTDLIRQGVRSIAHQTGASFAGIRQSQLAADAADKNLKLVTDAYSKGVVNIIDLIDAQNAALVAEDASATSIYSFLIDLIALERSMGVITALLNPEKIAELEDELHEFFKAEGIQIQTGE